MFKANSQLRFDGRVAIITGAGSGLGRAHAELLAARGASVIVNDLLQGRDRAEQVCAVIESHGGRAVPVIGRVGHDADARELVAAALDHFGRLDIVVNNAGIPGTIGMTAELAPTDTLEAQYDVHLRGPMQLNRAAWPHFVKQQYGRILFTTSPNGTGWMPGAAGYEIDYSTAKAAIFALVRQTAGAGLPYNIKANSLMPWAYTTMVDNNYGGSELGQWMSEHLSPEAAVAGVLPLLHESCPENGETISSAGGRVARVFFAATRGYFDPDLTPENVLEHWAQVAGGTTADGCFVESFEQTFVREQAVLNETIRGGKIPDLTWIAEQNLKPETGDVRTRA